MLLCAKMNDNPAKFAQAWNFGPGPDGLKDVQSLVSLVIKEFGTGSWDARNPEKSPYEAQILALDITKARIHLGWKPLLSFEEAIGLTVSWYKKALSGNNLADLSLQQILNYQKRMDFENY